MEKRLFEKFRNYLNQLGLYLNEGKIVDASFVEVPRQRNRKEENEQIKTGEGESLWNDQPNKKCQKDIDARWTQKGVQKYFGYKDHAKIDAGSKLPQIIERAFRGKPLTEEQKESNRIKSKTRCRVEHAFGFVTNSMNDFYIQSIGFRRAKGVICLINLVYNMCRYEQIVRLNLLPIKC